jgi:hypothetical protein
MENPMAEPSSTFFVLSVLLLAAVLAVFAMRYAVAAYGSRLESRRQSAADESLDGLRREVAALATRVNAIEKLLREVE